MKIIVDTNLWISFMIGRNLSALDFLCNNESFSIHVCEKLLYEIEQAGAKPKIRKYISEKDIIDTLKLINTCCIFESVQLNAVSPVRDPKRFIFAFTGRLD